MLFCQVCDTEVGGAFQDALKGMGGWLGPDALLYRYRYQMDEYVDGVCLFVCR